MTFREVSGISYFNPKQTFTSILLKAGLKNFAKFTGKHLRRILFLMRKIIWKTPVLECLFNKVAVLNFIKKETPGQVFSCESCKTS